MSQFSWNILEITPATLYTARKTTEKCNNEILYRINSSPHRGRIISQMECFIQSLHDIEYNNEIQSYFNDNLPCLYLINTIGVVQIHPSFLGNIHNGVYYYLSNFLMHYDEEFKGVWISCGGIKYLDSLGYLTSDDPSCTVSIRISLNVLVFIPKVDDILIGKINRTRPQSISILIYGIFNGTIKSDELTNVIKYENDHYKVINSLNILTVNTTLSVKVTNVTILPKNQWINLTTTIDEDKLIVI